MASRSYGLIGFRAHRAQKVSVSQESQEKCWMCSNWQDRVESCDYSRTNHYTQINVSSIGLERLIAYSSGLMTEVLKLKHLG